MISATLSKAEARTVGCHSCSTGGAAIHITIAAPINPSASCGESRRPVSITRAL
jgi:hypothetical protein